MPIRFRLTIDGTASGERHGACCAAARAWRSRSNNGFVGLSGAVGDRMFAIEIRDPAAQAFAFIIG